MDRILTWLEWPIHFLMWVGLLAGFLMMTHVSLDVAGRAFWQPLTGTTEIVSGYYMIAVAYLPWALIARKVRVCSRSIGLVPTDGIYYRE